MSWLARLIEALLGPLRAPSAKPAPTDDASDEQAPEASSKPLHAPLFESPPSAAAPTRAADAAGAEPAAMALSETEPVKVLVAAFKNDRDQAYTRRVADTLKTARAVAALDAALRVFTKERDRRRWHETMNLKGTALATAGSINLGAKELEDAVAVLREVLDDSDRRMHPLQWTQASIGLGSAVFPLAKRTSDRAMLTAAIAHFDAALAIYEERNQAVAVGVVGKNLRRAHRLRDSLG